MAAIRAEQTGWLMSGALHVGVAVVALVGLPQLQRPLPDLPPPIAIEFVQISEQTRVAEPEPPKAEPQQAQSQPQPQLAAAEAEPEPPTDAVPTLEQVKVVDTPPPPKPKPQVSENRQLANRVVPRAKPKPPSRLKTKAISQTISALLDKSQKEQQQETLRREEEQKQAAEKEPENKPNPFSGIRDRVATASVMDALRLKVESNWSFPGGAKDIQNMRVTIRIWIRPDGYYSRAPEFIGVGNLNDPDRSFFRIFAESARRAVLLSEPLDEAAKHLDANTSYIDFEFNPAAFVGE